MLLDPSIPPDFAAETLSQLSIVSTKPMAGGLSGARVWRCQSTSHGLLCLRQWPTSHPTQRRLQFIHSAIEEAQAQLSFVPRVHRDQANKSFWVVNDCLWEVTQWMPGEANYLRRPSREKLWSAVEALVRLHRVWFEFSHEQSFSPCLTQRIDLLSGWMGMRDLVERVGHCVRGPVEGVASMSTVRLLHTLGPQLMDELKFAAEQQVIVQPVLRDIWSDHLLFDGEQVTGIIDFGTVRLDEPATDLARMLGSLHPFELNVRLAAMERYNELLPERSIESSRVELLDRSGTLLTALQWMQWLVLERKNFAVNSNVLSERWQTALSRMMGANLDLVGSESPT